MLRDLGWLKKVKLLDVAGATINPATNEKLDELKTKLQSIYEAVDGLELTADNIKIEAGQIDLNTDELETKVQSIRTQLDVLLSTRASESTLQQLLYAVGSMSGTDILTEIQSILTGLNTVAQDSTLIQIRDYLDTVETKLQSILDKLDVNLSTRASETTLGTVKTNLDDVKTKLDTLNSKDFSTQTTLALIKAKTDNLDTLLSSRVAESTFTGRVGEVQATPTSNTLLGRLKDIWDKLVELFNPTNGTAKIKLWDGTNQANITTDNKLKVEAYQPSGVTNIVKIIDGEGNGYLTKVDSTGRLLVSTQVVVPPNTTPVSVVYYSNVSGTVDNFYVIPNGVNLRLTRFSAGAEVEQTAGQAIELYYAPNGTTTGIILLDIIFASGNSDQHDLDDTFAGNGTRSILIRRRRLSGGSKLIYGKFGGYY
jgi:hypothetical protein